MLYKTILTAVLLLSLGLCGSVFSQVPQTERPFINPIELPAYYLQAVENGTRTNDGRPGPNYWQQFSDYTINALYHPDQQMIEGSVAILYQNNSPDTLYTLELDLDLNMHKEGTIRIEPAQVTEAITLKRVAVEGVAYEQSPRGTARYNVNATRLMIVPENVVAPGSSVHIEVDFTLHMPQQGAGGRVGHDSDNVLFAGYWYPRMATYDDLIGWHPDPFLSRAEFYHGFGNYNIQISAPADWVVMSTGAFLNPEEVLAKHILERYNRAAQSDETVHIVTVDDFGYASTLGEPGDTLTWKFRAEMVRDMAFSATRASFWDGARASIGDTKGDGTEEFIQVHSFWRDSAPYWAKSIEYMQHSITFLSEYTGFPYPWPHMTAVEAGNIIGGGMEFPMMTLIGDYNSRGPAALYSVTLHEIAHMWIPMIISTDERRYSWLDEGYTVFHTDSGKEDYLPEMNHREMTRQSYIRFALTGQEGEMMRRSDSHDTPMAFRFASYAKPATILTALRGVLGEDTFYRIHQEMHQVWGFKLMSPYDWFAFVEAESGMDLTWFWRSWYYETWTMDQQVESVHETRRATEITIRDNGNAPMPVHLRLTLSNGEEIDFIENDINPWLRGERTMTITVPHRNVVRVEIDAHRHFPDTNRSNNIWER
ncbi:MAG: M1 family metallopeptidase [Bacteroidetes bacterium]|nr:M1 family metallopeptidase [Bacteroidota bacterium]